MDENRANNVITIYLSKLTNRVVIVLVPYVDKINSLDAYNKLNQSLTGDPNVNYNRLHEVIKLAKDKHMPYKTVKFKKYEQNKSTWITLAIPFPYYRPAAL